MDWQNLDPPKALRLRYVLEDRLVAPGSTSGLIAERCRLGLATREPYQGDGAASVRADLADLLLVCRDLTPLEQRVCRLRYGSAAGSVTYEAARKIDELREGDGEEIIDLRPTSPDGSPMAGWVRVRGIKTRVLTYQEIAEQMAAEGVLNADGQLMTHGAVKRALWDASTKVATAIRARQAWQELEERSCI